MAYGQAPYTTNFAFVCLEAELDTSFKVTHAQTHFRLLAGAIVDQFECSRKAIRETIFRANANQRLGRAEPETIGPRYGREPKSAVGSASKVYSPKKLIPPSTAKLG